MKKELGEGMKLYQVDMTANLYFENQDIVDAYIHILKKSLILPHYKQEHFRDHPRTAKGAKAADEHSYSQRCRSATFFAYDKTARKMRKRMLCLLRKVSDCGNMSMAIKALKEEHGMTRGQIDRALKRFAKLGISPITLPNKSKVKTLRRLDKLL